MNKSPKVEVGRAGVVTTAANVASPSLSKAPARLDCLLYPIAEGPAYVCVVNNKFTPAPPTAEIIPLYPTAAI